MVSVALLVRLAVAAFSFVGVADPAGGYDNFGWELGWTARSIALGHGFGSPFLPLTGPTALVPPLYPYLLAGIFKVFGLYSQGAAFATLGLNSLFSALTCIPLYLSARESLGGKAARWVGWGWVVYPYSVYFSAGIVWEFALTGLLFATCFWLAQGLGRWASWGRWVGYGVMCGVTMWSNPSTLPVLVGLLGLAAWRGRQVLRPVVALIALGAMMLPWTVRNERALHVFCPMRDGFWLEAWAGNAGDSSESNPAWAHPASNAVEMQRYEALGETAYMDSKHRMAVDFIEGHPGWFAKVTARRVFRYWTGYWSFSRSYLRGQPLDLPNVLFCIPLTVAMLIGIRRWWRAEAPRSLARLGRSPLAPYLLAVVVFPLPYYVTHASMDYRQPIESVILTLIVAGFALRVEKPVKPVLEELSAR